jgi:hypothetical protein
MRSAPARALAVLAPTLSIGLSVGLAVPAVAGEMPLFNGKDLSGWTTFLDKKGPNQAGTMKAEDVWSVADGVLRCTGVPNGYIRTVAEHQDYVLKLEWRWPAAPGNSGVLLRVVGEDKIWPTSLEAQLKSGNAGDVIVFAGTTLETDAGRIDPGNPRRRASIKAAEKPAGEWNEYEITLDGERLTVKVNGELLNEGKGAQVRPGTIALQSEGAPIEFRNIRLAPIAR